MGSPENDNEWPANCTLGWAKEAYCVSRIAVAIVLAVILGAPPAGADEIPDPLWEKGVLVEREGRALERDDPRKAVERYLKAARLFDQIASRAEALGWSETAKVSRRKRIVKLHLLYRALRDLLRLRLRSAAQTLRYLRSHS